MPTVIVGDHHVLSGDDDGDENVVLGLGLDGDVEGLDAGGQRARDLVAEAGMRTWQPGWANLLNLPHCWITWMVPWGTQVQHWQDMATGAREKVLRDGEETAGGSICQPRRAERLRLPTIRHRKRRGERRKKNVLRRKPRWARGNACGRGRNAAGGRGGHVPTCSGEGA